MENIEKQHEGIESYKYKTLLENWASLTGAENIEEIPSDLSIEEAKKLLYEKISNTIDKTLEVLDIKINNDLLEKIKQSKDNDEKAMLQEAFINSLMAQLSSIPSGKWSFFPEQIQKTKKINCSGSSLLLGSVLKRNGIKSYYGMPAGHAVNIVELSDGSLWYADGRNRKEMVRLDAKLNSEEPQILEINNEKIFYKKIIVVPQEYSIRSIIGNFGVLKRTAENNIDKIDNDENLDAVNIYESKKDIFGTIKDNFGDIGASLYPEIDKYDNSELMADERSRVDSYIELAELIQGELNKLDKQTALKIKAELTARTEITELAIKIFREGIFDADNEKQFSPDTVEFIKKLKFFRNPKKL